MGVPFAPIASATLAATTASGRIALPGTFISLQKRTLRVVNYGPSEIFVELGDVTVVATAGGAASASPDGSMSIAPGAVEVFNLRTARTHLAGITASGTALLRMTVGEGE